VSPGSVPSPATPALAVLIVGLGGFVGSALRYLLGGWVQRVAPVADFPAGTFVVNVLGCLAIGIVAGLVELRHGLGPSVRLFLLVGLLGGFTTFSSFAWETLELARSAGAGAAGALPLAFANVALQVVLGLAAAWAGLALTRLL
jgi:CrcB protein